MSSLYVQTVVRWLSPTKKLYYHFSPVDKQPTGDAHRWIPYRLFQDDTRADTLTKLIYYLDDYYHQDAQKQLAKTEWNLPESTLRSMKQRKDIPLVAWDSFAPNKGFLFQTDTKWTQWKSNPWKLGTDVMDTLETLVQMPTHQSLATTLTGVSQFSFACLWDIPLFGMGNPLPLRWYSLYQDTRSLLSKEAVFEQHRILTELLQTKPAKLLSEWMDDYHESGVFHLAHRSMPSSTTVPLKALFDNIQLQESLPFIQWKEGAAMPVLYRLWKNHSMTDLNVFMDISKIPVSEQRIQIVYATTHKKLPIYIKCIFIYGKKPTYFITVKLRDQTVDTEWLQREINTFKDKLQKFSNDYVLEFNLDTTHIKAHSILATSVPILPKHLASFGWLFKLQNSTGTLKGAHTYVLTYLRSANMHQRLQPDEFIQSQLVFIENNEELIGMLQKTFHVSEAKARELLKDYYEGQGQETTTDTRDVSKGAPARQKRSWVDIPATVTMTYNPSTKSYTVVCDRFLNTNDLERMMTWLRGMVALIEVLPETSALPSSPTKEKKPVFVMSEEEESPDILLSSESSASRSRSSRSSSSSWMGGSYDLNEKLKEVDPELFIHTRLPNNKSRYPRLCSANTNQQPVVLTTDEMERIDASDYKNSYDGKLFYGSDKDPKKHHYYMCPRIWCPVSKVPLTLEQYKALGEKCPGPQHEEPWRFYDADYWGRNPNTPHYIGFHKKQGTNNLCLPCCKRLDKPPAEKEQILKKCSAHVRPTQPSVPPPAPSPPPPPSLPSPSVPEQEPPKAKRGRKAKNPEESKEDYYLLHFPAPISAQRWGVLPEALHKVLKPEQPYSHCYTQLKSDQQCPVRKGIRHHKDSLLNALGYIITQGKGGKREWLAHLEKHFTPLDFLTLHNGWILSNFLDRDPIYPQQNIARLLQWRDWVQTFPKYIQSMELKSLVNNAANVATMKQVEQLRLSRELAIYTAWQRFWNYLRSSEPKNIYFIYDLMLFMETRLIVWEKYSDTEVYLKCPMDITDPSAFIRSVYMEKRPYAMVMYENDYYEPIELKSRSSSGITQIHIDDSALVARLDEITSTCHTRPNELVKLHQLRLLYTLPETTQAVGLFPKQLVVSPNMMLYGVLLVSGIFVQWPHAIPMIYTREIMDILQVKRLLYLEDLEGLGQMDSKVIPTYQLSLYIQMLKSLKFKWNVSSIVPSQKDNGLVSMLTLKPMTQWNQLERAVIPTGSMLPLDEIKATMDSSQAYWIRLQRDIGRKVLTHYDTIKATMATSGIEGVLKLPLFQHLPDKADVRTLLEGMPLSKKQMNREAIYQWWNAIGMNERYPIYTHRVKEGFSRQEWIFAQGAVTEGLPEAVLRPSKVSYIPGDLPAKEAKTILNAPMVSQKKLPVEPPAEDWKPLPNKWLLRKQYGWDAYRRAEYPLMNIFQWISDAIQVELPLDILKTLHSVKVGELLNREDQTPWHQYLQDPFIWRALAKQMGIEQSKQVTVLKRFLKQPKETQWEMWENIFMSKTPPIAPNELDVLLYAHLAYITILVLHRSPSGQGVETGERHGFQDFVASATVFSPIKPNSSEQLHQPLVVLFKESKIDAEQSSFYWVQYEQKPYFKQLKEAPEILRKLVQAVQKAQKE